MAGVITTRSRPESVTLQGMSIRLMLRITAAVAAFCSVGSLAASKPAEFELYAVLEGDSIAADPGSDDALDIDHSAAQNATHRRLGRLRRAYEEALQDPLASARLFAPNAIPKILACNRPCQSPVRVIPTLAPISRRGPPSLSLA
jgi:hypothetical protein